VEISTTKSEDGGTMNLLMMIQEGAEHASEGGHEETPAIVTAINHAIGPATVPLQRAIMTPIYSMFGSHWTPPAPGEEIPAQVILALIAFAVCTLGVLLFRGTLSVDRPSNRQQVLEVFVDTIRGMLDDVVGPYGRRYLSVIGAFSVFILVGNLMGEVPGLAAATGNFNVTLALGLISFVYFITRGFKQQGIAYLKHFTGGLSGALLPLGMIIFFFELLSTFVRPFTLGLRLFLNMFVDHTIAGVFESIQPWIVPIFLPLPLAVFVALVQTMVFVLLSMVYLSETVPHDEHEHDEHGHHDALEEAQAVEGVAHAH
jgi:F-type H+-transporting ATPase subunit a